MTIKYQTSLDQTFQALAHQTRRDILERLLVEEGLPAGAFTSQFDVSQPTISRHLSQLESAGLIIRQVKGRSHVFFANPEAISVIDTWLNNHRAFWDSSLKRLKNFLDEDNL